MLEFNREPEQSFKVENTGRHQYAMTRLADNSPVSFDTLKVINLLSSFGDLRFETLLNNILPQERFDSIVQSPYLHRVTLTTKDGKVTQMTTFEKFVTNTSILEIEGLVDDKGNPLDPIDHNRLYGLVNDGEDLTLIQYYVFDKVLNPADYYMIGKPIHYEPSFYEVTE